MRTVVWLITIDDSTYMATAQTEASAVRKALAEHRATFTDGQQLRLGQGSTTIILTRSHRREMKEWQNQNKILM